MKTISIRGVHPHFVKCAPVPAETRKKYDGILIPTRQQYNNGWSSVFFKELGTPKPHHNLSIGYSLHGGKMLRWRTNLSIRVNRVTCLGAEMRARGLWR